MKNRILWIFETGEETPEASSQSTEFNAKPENSPFVALPWALFGSLAEGERTKMEQVYQLAYERTQAQEAQRSSEMDRFERLLEGVGVSGRAE